MVTAEEFVLQHAEQPYDPTKAHEYYERTKRLTGRRRGVGVESSGRRSFGSDSFSPRKSKIKTPEQRRKEIEARVKVLKARLEKLREVLRELVKQAQARSGIDPKDKSAKKAVAGKSKKLTATQKREAAKRSKEYREKNKNDKKESLSDQEKDLQETIKKVKEKIDKAREDLKAATIRAREQSMRRPAANSRRNS